MTLSQMIRYASELGRPNGTGTTVLSDWIDFFNQAQREISDRANWSFLHDLTQVTIASGETSIGLGENFKQLGEEENPISFDYGAYQLPAKVMSRARIEQLGIWPTTTGPFSLSIPSGYVPAMVVFVETNGPAGEWTLNVPPQYVVTTGITFNVSGYFYPEPITQGSDHNSITDNGFLAQAMVQTAKAIAFQMEDSASEQGAKARELAEVQIEKALYADAAKKMAGRNLRM